MESAHGDVDLRVDIAFFFACLVASGCANLTAGPSERADSLARQNDFVAVPLQSGLRAYWRSGTSSELSIYIEGDGAHWPRGYPPADPTPINPYALKLAIADTSANVAYLARACQYLSPEQLAQCPSVLWIDGRFGDAAINLAMRSIDELKAHTKAKSLRLVGYSGGGALAALVTARRSDVSCLLTIGAPLDISAWVAALGLSPLEKSRNPAGHADTSITVPQTHFQGSADTVVPPSTTLAYRLRYPNARFEQVEAYDHECCWDKDWATRIAKACQ